MEIDQDAYSVALQFLLAGRMPVVFCLEDGVHVMSIAPTSRETLAWMIHDDPAIRLRFVVSAAIGVREMAEAEVR